MEMIKIESKYYKFKIYDMYNEPLPFNNKLEIYRVRHINTGNIMHSGSEIDCLVWIIKQLEEYY
jgi:hypothetical protein